MGFPQEHNHKADVVTHYAHPRFTGPPLIPFPRDRIICRSWVLHAGEHILLDRPTTNPSMTPKREMRQWLESTAGTVLALGSPEFE